MLPAPDPAGSAFFAPSGGNSDPGLVIRLVPKPPPIIRELFGVSGVFGVLGMEFGFIDTLNTSHSADLLGIS